MESQLILFLSFGFILGMIAGYFLLKFAQQKSYVKKSDFDALQTIRQIFCSTYFII